MLSVICDHLEKFRAEFSLAYFPFDGKDVRLQDVRGALSNLLAQLLVQDGGGTFKHFEKEREHSVSEEEEWTAGRLWRVFESIVKDKTLRDIYLVLDALGGCLQLSARRSRQSLTAHRRMQRSGTGQFSLQTGSTSQPSSTG